MSEIVGVVAFVVIILLVVLVHEAGHFAMAKAFRIKVEEFFIGFGPRLWSFRRGETEYGVKAIPLGGYVRIAGMNPFQETPPADIPRTYGAKPAWQRVLVILAGPISHFFMALLVLAVYFVAVGTPKYQPVVGAVSRTLDGAPSPALQAGLRAGDVVVAVGPISKPTEDQFVAYTRSHVGRPVDLTVDRGGRTLRLQAVPVLSAVDGEQVGRLGIELTEGSVVSRERTNPFVGIGRAGTTVGSTTAAVVARLGDVFGPAGIRRIVDLIGGSPRTTSDPSGLVGGARLTGQAVQAGAYDQLFFLFALFNIFLGIVNILPLPPLDGGHLAVIAIEKTTGRRIDARRLVPVAAVVAGFLILLTVSLFYLDVVNPLPNPFR